MTLNMDSLITLCITTLLQHTETTPGTFLIMFKDVDHTTNNSTCSYKSLKYIKLEIKI